MTIEEIRIFVLGNSVDPVSRTITTRDSLINFGRGRRVMIHPNNLDKNDKIVLGTVIEVVKEYYSSDSGAMLKRRTGEVSVMWDGDNVHRITRYEWLKIVG